MKSNIFVLTCWGFIFGVIGSPKIHSAAEGGFTPSHRYYESDILTFDKPYNTTNGNKRHAVTEPKKEPKESRFGVISYGNSPTGGYDNGLSMPLKVDLSGVVIGVFIGLGAVLLIPKIAHLLAGGGGFGRSIDHDISSVTNVLSRIDNSLAAHDIDSTSCAQRIMCTFVSDAMKNKHGGESRTIDELILGFTSNPLFSYMLNGTGIKDAVDVGKLQEVEKCLSTYSKCPLNKENVLKIISSLLPAR
ncbi:uncharacterized protein LOC132708156 [Cylas formicarius]|uniref:uncharacterized protein LOC132708156 n=1 Tax=Cylas formicarius TaxID=197179 RepID=UPI0029584123|nr:uncharacterized protein LOC132708156 [Cylas formicarius]